MNKDDLEFSIAKNAAFVSDEYGTWYWFRRDYREIRTLIELGFEESFDYSPLAR